MDAWTNESVLEFINLLKDEPAIWNHRCKNHRNRSIVHESWIRIKHNFSLPCRVEELKRKRNSLSTQYRDLTKKIKESQQTASNIHEIYKPTWFAFDAMNSFLKDLYDVPAVFKQEELMLPYDDDLISNESGSYKEVHLEQESATTNNETWDHAKISNIRRLSHESNSEADSLTSKKRRMQVEKQKNDTYKRKEDNVKTKECELYGQLVAEKLKPLDYDDRLQLMNDIDNFVFNRLMAIRKRKVTQHSSNL